MSTGAPPGWWPGQYVAPTALRTLLTHAPVGSPRAGSLPEPWRLLYLMGHHENYVRKCVRNPRLVAQRKHDVKPRGTCCHKLKRCHGSFLIGSGGSILRNGLHDSSLRIRCLGSSRNSFFHPGFLPSNAHSLQVSYT